MSYQTQFAWNAAKEAGECFGVTPKQIMKDSYETGAKCRSVARARMLAMAICRRRWGWSYPEIGRAFIRDPSSAFYAVKFAEENLADLIAVCESTEPKRCRK